MTAFSSLRNMHYIKILLCDLDKYLNRQSTYARARPYGICKLDYEDFQEEHTKPIYNRLKILTVQNLFKYHCIVQFIKIMKYHNPYCLYEAINLSVQDTQHEFNNFIFSRIEGNEYLRQRIFDIKISNH